MGGIYLVCHDGLKLSDISPWKSVPVITTLILGGILIILFILWERLAPYPVFPRSLFTEKVLSLQIELFTCES